MRRITLLSSALLLLVLTAGMAAAAEMPASATAATEAAVVVADSAVAPAAPVVSTPAVEADAALCEFLELTQTSIFERASAGYQCPPGVAYCQRDSQCANQCGGFFGVCEFGCCACAG